MIPRYYTILLIITILLSTNACKTFEVQDVNYTQEVESVLIPDDKGIINDKRHGLSFNILPFQFKEFKDSTTVLIEEIRLIRNHQGFYFITANGFKNVYVMEPINSGLKLKKKININEEGLIEPIFNMRSPFVQLIDTQAKEVFTLSLDGIKKREAIS